MNLDKRANEMKSFFNKVKDGYDDRHLKLMKGKERVIDFLPKNINRILDLGAGTGLQLIKLYKLFPNVKTIAIDASDGMLQKLKDRNLSDNIEIINTNFFNYDFGKEVNDAVISTQALHHFNVEDKTMLYKKVYDSLKKDGLFIIEDYYVFTDEEEKQKMDDYINEVRGKEANYDTPLTINHEVEILKSVGFKKVETEITEDYKIIISKK